MADVVLTRVDFRLIHGQIIIAWNKVYQVGKIVIIDDMLAKDEFMTKIYASAAPAGVVVKVYDEQKAKRIWEKNQFGTGKVMVLFKNIETCSRAIKDGVGLKKIQLGGVPHAAGKKVILNAVSLNEEEMNLLKELKENYGVEIELHITPSGECMDYDKITKIFNS